MWGAPALSYKGAASFCSQKGPWLFNSAVHRSYSAKHSTGDPTSSFSSRFLCPASREETAYSASKKGIAFDDP